MKSRIALLVLAACMLGSVSEAGLFHRGKKSDDEKKAEAGSNSGARANIAKFNHPEWGNEWKRIFREPRPYAVGHYNQF